MSTTKTCSAFTQALCEYEQNYYKSAYSEKDPLIQSVKKDLIGRIVSIGVSFLLHAEAVYRAVIICFLTIKEIFTKSTEELRAVHIIHCKTAYTNSLRAFFGISPEAETPKKQIPSLASGFTSESTEETSQTPRIIDSPQGIKTPTFLSPYQSYQRPNAPTLPKIDSRDVDFTTFDDQVSLPTQPQPRVQPPLTSALQNYTRPAAPTLPKVDARDIDFTTFDDQVSLPTQPQPRVQPPLTSALQNYTRPAAPTLPKVDARDVDFTTFDDQVSLPTQPRPRVQPPLTSALQNYTRPVAPTLPKVDARDVDFTTFDDQVSLPSNPQKRDPRLNLVIQTGLSSTSSLMDNESLASFEHIASFVKTHSLEDIPEGSDTESSLSSGFSSSSSSDTEDDAPELSIELRHQLIRKEIANMTNDDVRARLEQANQMQPTAATVQFSYLQREKSELDFNSNPNWSFAGGTVGIHGGYPIGRAQFINTQHPFIHTHNIANININGEKQHAYIISLVDPEKESPHIEKVFNTHLKEVFEKEFAHFTSQNTHSIHIWRAIHSTTKKLDLLTGKGHYASAAFVFIINNVLWVANYGLTQAVVSQTEADGDQLMVEAVQRAAPKATRFGSDPKANSAMITNISLDLLGPHAYLVVGSHNLFRNAGSDQIIRWVENHSHDKPVEIAGNLVYSDYQYCIDTNTQTHRTACTVIRLGSVMIEDYTLI